MKRLKKLTALVVSGILSLSLAGCGTQASTGTQRYAWPLGTSSPEDTVTQIYAERHR